MVLLCKVKNPQRFGVAKFDQNGNLVQLIEKPEKPPSDYALTGIYFFRPAIFEMIRQLKPSWRGELEITEAIQLLLKKRRLVGHKFVEGWWKDTGTYEDILDANRLVLEELKREVKGKVEDKRSILGKVRVEEGARIRRGAKIQGPAVIGRNSIVGGGASIGPYTSVGDETTVKRGEIKNSIIMEHCIIDVNENISDSIVGAHSEIISSKVEKPRKRTFIVGEKSNIVL